MDPFSIETYDVITSILYMIAYIFINIPWIKRLLWNVVRFWGKLQGTFFKNLRRLSNSTRFSFNFSKGKYICDRKTCESLHLSFFRLGTTFKIIRTFQIVLIVLSIIETSFQFLNVPRNFSGTFSHDFLLPFMKFLLLLYMFLVIWQ